MAQELVHLEISRGVATITLDSPRNRNALSRRLRKGLADHLRTALEAEAVRVVVLTHSGPAFCAGADLKEVRDGDAAAEAASVPIPELLATLLEAPKPVVARIAGSVRAGGIGLVASCDLAVASTAATFALTEVRVGVVPALISVPLLPLLGRRAAQELALTGANFGATRAVEVGLLTRAVPDQDLDAEVEHFVGELCAGAPEAVAATKAVLAGPDGSRTERRARLAAMSDLSQRHFASEEASEGIAAFREKRPPRWIPRR
ncbi:MAG: enoyl-CoA hydratase-related protein [Candidatus Dormibacteraceae bacterium]